jgi:transmembrane 9 superfamily protein 2/4
LNAFLFGCVLAAPIGGFVTGRLFKTIGDGGWRGILLRLPSMSLKGIAVFVVLYFLIFRPRRAAIDLPLGSLLAYAALNFGLGVAGAVLGMKTQPLELAQKVNQLPRQIPPKSYLQATVVPRILAAIFVYAAPAANIHMLMLACWTSTRPYYNYSAILANLFALAAQATICGMVVTFWSLSNEDFRWWWTSYNSAGGAVVLFALYALYFLRVWWVELNWPAAFVFCAVVAVMGAIFRCIVGALAFLGSFAFVQLIYSSLKME